jgi:hypothetical protein
LPQIEPNTARNEKFARSIEELGDMELSSAHPTDRKLKEGASDGWNVSA